MRGGEGVGRGTVEVAPFAAMRNVIAVACSSRQRH